MIISDLHKGLITKSTQLVWGQLRQIADDIKVCLEFIR